MKRPSFQFYPGDWLSSLRVSEMSFEAEGIYIRMLCFCWRNERLPSDPERLKKILGKSVSDDALRQAIAMFEIEGEFLYHQRLFDEIKKQEKFSKEMSEAGKKGNKKRWGSQKSNGRVGDRVGDHEAIAKDRSSSSSSSSSSEENTDTSKNAPARESGQGEITIAGEPRMTSENFMEFWSAYPNKKKRGYAKKIFMRLSASLLPRILSAIAEQKKSHDWVKENGKYIPHPATWLNGECWEDEVVVDLDRQQPGETMEEYFKRIY